AHRAARPARGRQGNPGADHREPAGRAGHLHGRHLPGQRERSDRAGHEGQGLHGRRGPRPRRDHRRHGQGPPGRGRRRRRLPARRLPPHHRPGRAAARVARRPGAQAGPCPRARRQGGRAGAPALRPPDAGRRQGGAARRRQARDRAPPPGRAPAADGAAVAVLRGRGAAGHDRRGRLRRRGLRARDEGAGAL
ncbi:MAG: Adenylate kinase, partial [uncultured Blastococcus sp.]